MAYTDKYNLQLDRNRNYTPYITLAEYGITFPSDTLECLNHAQFVHVYYDDDNKVVAFKGCKEDEYSHALCKAGEKQQRFVRWSGHHHRDHIAKLLNVQLTKQGIRLDGKYLEDEDLLIFELNDLVK